GRVDRHQKLEMPGRAARLLAELSLGAVPWILSGFQSSGGNLVEKLLGGVTVLPQQQQLRIVAGRIAEKRNHRARTRMTNHVELANRPIGKANGVGVQLDDSTGVRATAADFSRDYPGWCRVGCAVARHAIGWPCVS